MPTLEDILKAKKEAGSANIVPMPRGNALTMEEIQALNSGKPDPLPNINSPNIIKDKNGNPILDKNSPGISDSLYAALNSPKVPTIEQALQGVIKSKYAEDESTDEDISDQLARYDFPLYAETDALNEATAYNRQSNMDAIIKGAKNIVPVAIGVGAQMLGGTMQVVNNLLGDDDYDNPITEWGRDFMKNNMNIIYQSPDGKALSSAKSAIAAGSDILGQFGSAVGSMVAMSPINTGIVRGTTALGTALGGPLGGMIGSIAGTIGAAALNAYSEGVIDASEVYNKKYKELWNNTRNLQETQKVAKLAAQTVANQNMILNTGLNIIPVIWSTKPWGVDKAIKRSLGLPDADTKWFNLQKPYAPNKLVDETFDEYTKRLANIKANQFVNNKTYSLTENPFEALKNIKAYGTQKVANIKYNALHPIEYLHRNWDIVGETIGEGLEEYHNYFAREQGLKVFREEDASKIPSMSKLVKGYADMITKGDGAYDLIAGSIIGGMSSPIMSGFHFGRSKVYNPDTGQMDYKFKRNKMFDWIPFELNHDYDQKEYENLIVNSLQRINDVKALGKSYVDAKTPEDKDKVINQLLVAPLTKYVDDNTFDAFMLSLDAMKKNIDTLGSSDDFGILQDYMSATDKINFQNLQTQLDNETDESKQQGIVVQLDSIKDKAKKLMTEHSSTLAKRIDFLKSASEDYKKLKDDISANYGDEDYGFANALFKNKMAFEIEQDILKKSHENLEKVKRNFKDKIRSTNPNAPDYVIENIMNELIRNNSNDPNYTDNINDFLSAKKAMLESEFRLERFAHRYVSLSTWGYSNDSDLQRELELVEDISNFVMSDDEIRNLANADKFEEINNYLRFLPMLEAQLSAETDPTKKAELQAQVNSLNNLKSLIDPTTNEAYAKYQLFKSLQEELKQVMQRQVSYKLDFKGNEYNYKGFTPLEKYLKRNKMIADELQKLSSAKRDMDILNGEIISVYKEYADKYSDAFTEEQKQLSVITNELQKLVYDGVIDMSRKQEVDDWLNNHDAIFNEVMGKLLAVTIKYSQPGMENPFIVNYAKRMIQQMNYQKDVIDQLRQLQFYYHAKLIISKDTDIIDLLNSGAITVPEALDYVRNSKVIHDSLRPMLIDAINNHNTGTNYEKEISIPMDLPIVYINTATNDMVVINNIKIKYSNKDGVLEKNESFDTDVDLKDYVQFKDDTEINEQKLKDDLRYLALILKAVDYMPNENAEKLLTEIYSDFNTLINRIKEYAISNNLNKDSMDVIKDVLGGFKYSTDEIKESNKKLIELLSNITLFLHDSVFNESTILKKGSDHKLLKNIDNSIFEDIINNSSLYNMNTLYNPVENHAYYNISKIINDNSLYKILNDGTIIFFSLPYYYPYFDENNKQNLLNFLNSITNIGDVEKNISSINQNYRLIVFNPNDNSYTSYTDGAKLIEDVNTNKDVFRFNKSEWDKSRKKTEKIEETLEVKWKKLFNLGKSINLEDVNNVNEILNNTTDFISGKNKEAEYVWVLWKLSDTKTNNPHMFIYLKSIHDSKYTTYKDEYDSIVKRYEKSISDTDTEVFASDDAGIIYKIKSVKGIIESERSDDVSQLEIINTKIDALEVAKGDISEPISKLQEGEFYIDVGTVTNLPFKSESTLKNKLKLGKIQGTDYEIKSDGIYYKNKIIDNSENLLPLELVKRHINERRNNALADVNKDKIDYYTELKSIDAKKGTIEKVTLYKVKGRADKYIQSGKMYLFIDPELGLNSPGVNAHIELYKYDLNKKGYDFDLKKATVNLDSHTATIPIIKLPSVIDVDGKINAKYNTELKAVESGISYDNIETNSEKGKTEKEVLDNIRSYYYDLVKSSPLIGTQEGRNAALETIKRLPDLQMLAQFIRKLYTNIREADYIPTRDNPFDNDIEEITEKATKNNLADLKNGEDIIVVNQNGWHYRQVVGIKKDPVKYRFSLNIWGNKDLIKILDDIAIKYKIYYKTPNSSDKWNDRHDPVTIYISNSSLTESQIDELKKEIVEKTEPYIRSNNGFGIYGDNISKGVEFGLESTQEEVNRILNEAAKLSPLLEEAIKKEFTKRKDGTYKSSVGQNMAAIQAIDLFKRMSTKGKNKLNPDKIYFVESGVLKSINQQGTVEIVRDADINSIKGRRVNNSEHVAILNAIKNSKIKLHNLINLPKFDTNASEITNTSTLFKKASNNSITLKVDKIDDRLIKYSFIDELKRFIYKDIDERFIKFLNSMYIVEPPKKDGVKKDPTEKVDKSIQEFETSIKTEYADYIFEVENGVLSQNMLVKLEKLAGNKIINKNSTLYKSIKNLVVTNRGAYNTEAKLGNPILTLADLYFTGILSINMKNIEKSKNEIIAKLDLLKKALFEPETTSEELSDMSKAFVNNARGSDLIFVNGNYVSFKTNDILKEQSINDDTEISLGETTILKLMPIGKVRELGKEIMIDSNYFVNINSIFSNEELLYDIYKNNHMLLNYNVDRFLINNDIAKVIVNSITDELRAKFANRLLNEIKEGLKDSSKAEKWGFMFSIKDGKNDNRYNIFMYNKKSNPNAKKSYNHEVQKVNITNDELKITIAKDGDSKQLITYDEKLLLKGLIDGTIKIGIMDEIIGKINPDNNNRVKPLNKDYAWQKNSYVVRINLDGTNTLRKFDLELNEEPESIYLGATEIGYTDYKLYYDKLESDKFYGRNLRKGENSLTEVVFYDKDNNWKSFYTFIPFVIFPFFEGKSGIDINEKFEKVFNELESTFTIYDIISKMFHKIERFNVSRGNINEFKALLESLKSNEIFKDKNLDSTDFILYYIADFMNYAGLLNKNISLTLDPLKFNNIDGIINIANFIKEVKEELGNIDFNDVELVLERLKLSKNELDVDDIINEEDKKIDNGESIDDTEGDIKADDSFDVSDNRGELVLNETAIANSHRKYEFFSTNIIDTFTQIDMPIIDNDGQFSIEPLLSTVLSDSIKDKRSADMKKTLEEGIPLQDKIKIKVQYSNNDIKFIHDGEEYSVSNRGQYIDLLNKVFNKGISINKYEFLKREKLLDLLYMYDIKIDNNGNILSIEVKSSMSSILVNHSNQNERDVAIKQWYNTQSLDENLLRKLFIISRMQMIISTNNDDNTHLGYVHDLPYIINHISSVSQHNRVKFSKTVIEQLNKEILYVIESFNKKIELYNSFENTDEVLATAEFSNYGKVNTLNGDREPLVTAMKKETYYKYIVTKVLENGLYNFKLENMDDSGKYVDQLYKNMPASDYLRFILIPYFSINNDGDNLSFEQASSKIIKIISDINNSQDNELNNILTAVDSKGNAISDMSKLYSIYQLKNEFLDVKSKVENRALALKYSEREPIFNYLIISVKNKFSNETKFFKASNLRLKELNVPSVYSQDNLNDDDFKNVELKRKKSEKLMEILLENIISLINDIRANRKKANILFDNNFKDPLLKLRNIIKTVIIEQELNIKNKKAGNSQNQIYDNNKNILNKLSGYKGDITTLFYLSIKTGNKIHKSKLVFATKKGNIVSLIEIPIYNEGKLVDASVLPTVKVYDISKGVDVKTFTTFSYNEDLLKEAILDSYLIAHYDESKTKKVIKDIIDSDSYSDYLSYIFDTHVNGINGHYFINPVITIGNIDESDKKQPETQVESQVAQSENVADLSNKIDEVVDKIKNNRVLNSLKVHLDTILLIKNYFEFISNNINDINNIINSTDDTKTKILVNKLVTKFNNYCKS